jgi:hypothetical protein
MVPVTSDGDQAIATLTRMLQIPVHRQTDGDPSAWDEMQEAMERC